MRLIVLLLTTLCYDTPSLTGARAEAQRNIRAAPGRIGRLTKRQDDLGYLEQCSILQFWDKQIGRVNVLAFFDSTWPFSHRQAAMLKILRERFDKTGFENIQFLAINAAPGESEYVSRAEVEVEEETWKQISPSEAEGVPAVEPSAGALAAALGPDVYFIQDSAELQIWPKLRAFRDQILVIDRCGRLTYQVIVPWSILHFPYVKAAILSTYKDEPCGACELQQLFDHSGEGSGEPSEQESEARTWRPDSDEPTTVVVGRAPTDEAGSDGSLPSQFSQSTTADYDAQTAEPTPTPPIDANDAAPPRENATSIDRADADSTTTQPPPPQFAEQSTLAEDELFSIGRTGDDYEEVTRAPDDATGGSIANGADCDSTSLYSRDDDHYNLTDTGYEDVDGANFASTTQVEDAEGFPTTVTDETVPTTDDPTNSSDSGAERRLADAKEIESLDARDVLKSRSTNARSVSPSDGSDNRLQVIELKSEATSEQPARGEEEEAAQLEADYLIPIRIIMRAPHVDEYSDRSLKAHEYLVLKTGQPSYHEHLDAPEPQQQHDKHDKHVRKKAGAAVRSTFARDESPGLYGELADYWQNYGNEQSHDDAAAAASPEDDDHEHVLEQEQGFAEGASVSPSSLTDERTKALESDNEQPYDDHSTSYEDADVIDEEAKSKLIAHYSKLLPWLYYVLAK